MWQRGNAPVLKTEVVQGSWAAGVRSPPSPPKTWIKLPTTSAKKIGKNSAIGLNVR